VQKKIFGPKKDMVIREWRRLHNEELHDLYSSSIIIWVIKLKGMKWVEHVAHLGEKRRACRVFVRKPEGKGQFERHRHRLENNIKMNLEKISWTGLIWLWIGTNGGCCEYDKELLGP
jgi:hypothetical protein